MYYLTTFALSINVLIFTIRSYTIYYAQQPRSGWTCGSKSTCTSYSKYSCTKIYGSNAMMWKTFSNIGSLSGLQVQFSAWCTAEDGYCPSPCTKSGACFVQYRYNTDSEYHTIHFFMSGDGWETETDTLPAPPVGATAVIIKFTQAFSYNPSNIYVKNFYLRGSSKAPTNSPTVPSIAPSGFPTLPTLEPTLQPTLEPTQPSQEPTELPSYPSYHPTMSPTFTPTLAPTKSPSAPPSNAPTTSPSIAPSLSPTKSPSLTPSKSPSVAPSLSPTKTPSNVPTLVPTVPPSNAPSKSPSAPPTNSPTMLPTSAPTFSPVAIDNMLVTGVGIGIGSSICVILLIIFCIFAYFWKSHHKEQTLSVDDINTADINNIGNDDIVIISKNELLNGRNVVIHSDNNEFTFQIPDLEKIDDEMFTRMITSIKSHFNLHHAGGSFKLYENFDGKYLDIDNADDLIDAFEGNIDDIILNLHVKVNTVNDDKEGIITITKND
eukprot:401387_1